MDVRSHIMVGKPTSYLALALLAVALLSFLYLGSALVAQHPANASATVRVSYAYSISAMPFWVAEDLGYFKQANITVEGTSYQALSLITQSVLSGKADVGVPIGSADLFAIDAVQPGQFKVFMVEAMTLSGTNTSGVMVRPNSAYESLADLKGKRIAIYPGLTAKANSRWLLGRYFNASNMTYIATQQSAILGALAANQVDAILTVQPIMINAVKTGVARNLPNSTNAENLNPNPEGVYAFSSAFAEQNPGAAARFANAMENAMKYIEADPQGTLRILASHMNMTLGQLESNDTRTPWMSLAMINGTFSGQFGNASAAATLQKLADRYYESGYINGTVNLSDVTYVQK
ncbi:NMT1/THI5 like protein [uncultured archaeon]|nr:NMT1/THI5 like protein [uncultured archaeon]